MKKINYLVWVALLGPFFLQNQTSAQAFYDINTVQKIEIVFKQSNWDYLLDTAKAGSESYIMAESVTINGVRFDSVGVKYKGNSTYNANQIKNPFHIELDTYKEQDYQGYTDIKLSNAAKDPSFVREVLSYSILRKYMNASLSNYANVYVNGKLMGLYVSSESVGKKFVNKNFFSKTNAFFKCNPIDGAGMGTTNIPNLVYLGADSASYYKAYEMNSDHGWKDLINLCNVLNNDISKIETVLDVDRALWMIAFNNVLVNLDSYIGVFAQNYYLYKDNTGRFNSVLWDFNESFGTFSQSGTINYTSTASKSQMTHLLHAGDAKWPLVQKLLSIPTYKKMYLAHMYTILTENFSDGSYLTTAQSLQPIINSSVQADPYKFFTFAQYQSNLTTDVTSGGGPGGGGAPGISSLMNARSNYLLSLADFTAAKPSITNIAVSEPNPKVNSNIFVTASVTNTNTNAVYLGYRSDVADKFVRVLMYDDGLHGDGASGDNTFGASIPVSGTSIQYYLYAENNNAGVFSPVRAEHEYYSLKANGTSSSSDIVMNEIYSRGTSANPDWVEIYNSSSSQIDVSGYKIYDSGGQSGTKAKKVFPSSTVIEPKGFYVIITDDSEASGFGLSNSGEKVWLENVSGTVIDTVTFQGHTAVQSYGRETDGGEWKLLNSITRGTSNSSTTNIATDSPISTDYKLNQNYPNPFNPQTTISFSVPTSSLVSLIVYDALGRNVATLVDELLAAGNHQFRFNGTELASGVYFYQMRAGNFVATKKFILLK
ncbi:MAG: CotH kinase family protein [Melioribacteraceae bacterium]